MQTFNQNYAWQILASIYFKKLECPCVCLSVNKVLFWWQRKACHRRSLLVFTKFCQFILDCSVFPEVITTVQKEGKIIRNMRFFLISLAHGFILYTNKDWSFLEDGLSSKVNWVSSTQLGEHLNQIDLFLWTRN